MKISVIGLGYVGSVAAAGLAAGGHQVLGIDVDRNRVKAYRHGSVPIYEPGLAELMEKASREGSLRFLHSEEVSEDLGEVVLIATGTPPSPNGAADLSQVKAAVSWVKEKQKRKCVIVMKSTVPCGTGVRLRETMLLDTPFQYVSNPEFLREGQAMSDWFQPDRIVIGGDDDMAIETAKKLYLGIEAPYMITDITSAETVKYAANAFLATKISFINEIAMLCDRIGASIDDVAAGVALDPRIGSSFLKAGVGYGGSCFPKDVDSLDHTALTNGHSFQLLRSVIAVNNRQRHLPLQALRERFGRLSGVSVGVLGLAFKPHTDDVREAPSIDLIRLLVDEGAQVKSYDPKAMDHARVVIPQSVQLVDSVYQCAGDTEALVLMTEWPEFMQADWREVYAGMKPPKFLFDGRNALNAKLMHDFGFAYQGVGRGSKAPAELAGQRAI